MNKRKLLLLGAIVAAIVVFFASGAQDYFTLQSLKASQSEFQALFAESPYKVAGTFFVVYVAMAALSLPGAALLTLLGGALFGFGWGLLLISFASTIGATLAFLISRTLLRESIEKRFRRQLESLNRGVEREGGFYLFTLRLVPVFPFFIVNLVMGLTRMRVVTFYVASQLGMLAGTAIYVNAGRELGQLESLSGILSPGLIASFIALGLFPLIAKKIVGVLRKRKQQAAFDKPKTFDYDMVVIGAGSAGLVTSYIASAVNARVALIERHKMGGDCLNTGCVPSKALIRAGRAAHEIRQSARFGITANEPEIDFAKVMGHVHDVVESVEPHDSIERYEGLGVEVHTGSAMLKTPWEVEVDGRVLTTRNVVIATGARPRVPAIPGMELITPLTSENLWDLKEQPRRLVVLGSGPIGMELGQSFARLGSQVTIIEGAPRVMPREDEEVSTLMHEQLAGEGVDLRVNSTATRIEVLKGKDSQPMRQLVVSSPGGEESWIEFDELLVAIGREANVEGFGLEDLGIAVSERGTIDVSESLQTLQPNIWACGDVAGPYQFTHAAGHQAWHAAVNALFGGLKTFKVDYRIMPMVTYTEPEVARVGLNETEAKAQGYDYEVTHYAMGESDRALAERATEGFVKVLTEKGRDRILGVTLVGASAGEWLAEFTMAMKHGIGLNKILSTIHPYPTLSEANKAAAGMWKNAHKPEGVLKVLDRYFTWRRNGRFEPTKTLEANPAERTVAVEKQ